MPFATFDGAESGKYPASFTLPGKGHAGADKVGTVRRAALSRFIALCGLRVLRPSGSWDARRNMDCSKEQRILQLGGSKDFDPEIYRQAIRNYNTSKVAAPRAAYRGAGDILHHPGATGPEMQQVRDEGQDAEHTYGGAGQAANVMTLDAAHAATSADSVVPPTEVADSVAVGAVSNEPELNERADVAAFAAQL